MSKKELKKYNDREKKQNKFNKNPFQAGLFWGNLTKPYYTDLGFLKEAINQFKVKLPKTPYFIFTGMNHIDLEWIKQDQNLLEHLSKHPVHFYLYEPVVYNIESLPYNLSYYAEFHSSKNEYLHAVELDILEKFKTETGLNIIVHTCDYNINKFFKKRYKNLTLLVDDIFLKLNASIYFDANIKRKNIKKHFWTANSRYTPHRHLITNYLADKDGNYSWYFNTDVRLLQKSHNWIEPDLLPWNKILTNEQILNSSNFVLDHSIEKISVIDYNVCPTPSLHGFNRNLDFINSFADCFCAVVNETRFAQPTGNFSEKIFNPIQTYTPFIVAAPPFTLEYIKELGFKTFDNWWDENYDKEENHSKRLSKIYETIDYINSLSIKECRKMYKDMKDVLNHNYRHLKFIRFKDIKIYK